MPDKELDLGLDPVHARLTREEATKQPCFGGCGKSWDESGGGWFEFEAAESTGTQLAPRWFCDACSARRSADQPTAKAGVETKH